MTQAANIDSSGDEMQRAITEKILKVSTQMQKVMRVRV